MFTVDEELTILEKESDWDLPDLKYASGSVYWETTDPGWIIVRVTTPECTATSFLLVKTRREWLRDFMAIGIEPAEEPYPYRDRKL
jgi:hypothetical protein